MIDSTIISAGLARSLFTLFERNQIIQGAFGFLRCGTMEHWDKPFNYFGFLPIVSIMFAPPDVLKEEFKPYIFISFDYEPSRDERSIIKITERYFTTHFPDLISLN